MSETVVTLRIAADGSLLSTASRRAKSDVDSIGESAQRAGRRTADGLKQGERGAEGLSDSLRKTRGELDGLAGAVTGFITAWASFRGVGTFIRMADEAGQLRSRVALVTSGHEELARVQERIRSIARSTYQDVAQVSEVFLQSVEPMRQLGLTTENTLELTEAMSLALVAGGANAQRSSSAIDALGKAMQIGELRGNNLNTVIQNAPRFMSALETALGKTRREIIAMAEDGELTTQELSKVTSQIGLLSNEVESMPTTWEDAMTRVRNSLRDYFDDLNQSTGLVQSLVSGAETLIDHLDTVARAAAAAGIAVVSGFAAKAILAIRATYIEVGILGAALRALGGPIGAIVTVVGAATFGFLQWRDATDDVGRAARETDRIIRELKIATDESRDAAEEASKTARREAADRLEVARAALIEAQAKLRVAQVQMRIDGSGRGSGHAFNPVAAALGDIREQGDRIAEFSRQIGELDAALVKSRGGTADWYAQLQEATEGIDNGIVQSLVRMAGGLVNVTEETKANTGAVNENSTSNNNNTRTRERATRATRAQTEAERAFGEAIKASQDAMRDLQRMTASLADSNIDLVDEIAGADAAQIEFNRTIRDAEDAFADLIAIGPPTEDALRALADATDQATERLRLTRMRDAQRDALRETERVIDQWRGFWESGVNSVAGIIGDFATRQIKSFSDLGKALVSTVRDMVSQIITEFARLAIINLFTGQGGGYGQIFQAMGAGMAGIGGGAGGGLAGGAGGAAGSSGGVNIPGTGWVQVGRNIWQGMSQAWHGSGRAMSGSQWFGTGVYGPGMETAFAPTTLGYATAGAGALYAGYNRWQNSNGGVSGALGAGTYALGTYTAAMGAMGMASGAGAAAGAAGGFAALGGAAWIPIVGWIAAIAAAVDMLSGGRLFGTSFTADAVTQSIGVDDQGGYATNTLTEVRQRSLFRGRTWRDRDIDPSDEALAASAQLWSIVDGVRNMAADVLDQGLAPVIEGAYFVFQDINKGKPKGDPEEWFEILGRRFDEGHDEFIARLSGYQIGSAIAMALSVDQIGRAVADNIAGPGPGNAGGGGGGDGGTGREQPSQMVKTLDEINEAIEQGQDAIEESAHSWSESFAAVMAIADRWSGTAETFVDGMGFLLAAASDMVHGVGLLGTDGTLLAVTDLVEEYRGGTESLIETYARLVESTGLLERVADLTGTTFDLAREEFVRLAADIVEAVGGLDQARAMWDSYFTNFYDQVMMGAEGLFSATQNVGGLLEDLGLHANTGMQDFRAAFEEALPTLSADEVVQWLQAGDALAQITQATADFYAQAVAILAQVGLAGPGLSEFGQAIANIRAQEQQAIQAANAIAAAQGRESASTYQLAAIHTWASRQIAAAMRHLQAQTRDLIAQLFGGMPASLDLINAQIAELEQAGTVGGSLADGFRELGAVGDNLFSRWRSAIESLGDYLGSFLVGDLSYLTPEEQLAEAQSQLDAAIAAALGGDADAADALPQLMNQYARLLRGHVASGADYNDPIQAYHEQLQDILGLSFGSPGGSGGNYGGDPIAPIRVAVEASPELQALYEARDAALAEQEAAHRATLAQQLMQSLADMAAMTRTPILDMIAIQGVVLSELTEALGIDLENLTSESVLALGNMATTLGLQLAVLTAELGLELSDLGDGLRELFVEIGINLDEITGATVEQLAGIASTLGLSLTDMTAALGLELTDLAGGLTELTQSLGIDLEALTVESTLALADLARDLGADLSELTTSLGIDLGELTDSQSLLNQTFAEELAGLPQRERDLLEPLLAAVVAATTDADANAAIADLEDAVGGLSPAIRTELAPYFANIFPAGAMDDLDYLAGISRTSEDQLAVLRDIAGALDAPGYAAGTDYVPRDMFTNIHQGEKVIDANSSAILARYGIRVTGGGGDPAATEAVITELRQLRAEVAQLRASNDEGQRAITGAVTDTARQASHQRDDIARRQQDVARSTRYG